MFKVGDIIISINSPDKKEHYYKIIKVYKSGYYDLLSLVTNRVINKQYARGLEKSFKVQLPLLSRFELIINKQ